VAYVDIFSVLQKQNLSECSTFYVPVLFVKTLPVDVYVGKCQSVTMLTLRSTYIHTLCWQQLITVTRLAACDETRVGVFSSHLMYAE